MGSDRYQMLQSERTIAFSPDDFVCGDLSLSSPGLLSLSACSPWFRQSDRVRSHLAPDRVFYRGCVQHAALRTPTPSGRTPLPPKFASRLSGFGLLPPRQACVPFRKTSSVALGVGRAGTPSGQACTVAGSFRLLFGRIGSLEHEAPLVKLLLQDGLGDHLGFVLGN